MNREIRMALAEILKRAETSESLRKVRELLISGRKKVSVSGLVGSGKALLLAYLKKTDLKKYEETINKLGLRK